MVDISPGSGTIAMGTNERKILREFQAFRSEKDKALKEAKALEYYAKFLEQGPQQAYKVYLRVDIPEDIHKNIYFDIAEYQEKLVWPIMNAPVYMSQSDVDHFTADYDNFYHTMHHLPKMYIHLRNELNPDEYWMLDL